MDSREPMSCPEENIGPAPPRMTTRTVSSASARQERLAQLDQQAAVLRVAGPGRFSVIRAMVPSSTVSYVMYLFSVMAASFLRGSDDSVGGGSDTGIPGFAAARLLPPIFVNNIKTFRPRGPESPPCLSP